jgi:hypothetical protein
MIIEGYPRRDKQSIVEPASLAYRNLETFVVERVRKLIFLSFSHLGGLFIAEETGVSVGCVGAFDSPARETLEMMRLSVKDAFQESA